MKSEQITQEALNIMLQNGETKDNLKTSFKWSIRECVCKSNIRANQSKEWFRNSRRRSN